MITVEDNLFLLDLIAEENANYMIGLYFLYIAFFIGGMGIIWAIIEAIINCFKKEKRGNSHSGEMIVFYFFIPMLIFSLHHSEKSKLIKEHGTVKTEFIEANSFKSNEDYVNFLYETYNNSKSRPTLAEKIKVCALNDVYVIEMYENGLNTKVLLNCINKESVPPLHYEPSALKIIKMSFKVPLI